MRISDWSSDVCSSDLRSVRECWYRDPIRHPGLVPGSNVPQALPLVEGWMLEQVRHDGRDPCRTSEPAVHCSISTVEGWCLSRRSEERRVGKECVSTCRSRWSPYH